MRKATHPPSVISGVGRPPSWRASSGGCNWVVLAVASAAKACDNRRPATAEPSASRWLATCPAREAVAGRRLTDVSRESGHIWILGLIS